MNTFSDESLLRCRCCAPVAGCSYSSTVRFRLGIGTARFKTNVLGVSEGAALREASVMLGSSSAVYVFSIVDMGLVGRTFQCNLK